MMEEFPRFTEPTPPEPAEAVNGTRRRRSAVERIADELRVEREKIDSRRQVLLVQLSGLDAELERFDAAIALLVAAEVAGANVGS